MVLSVLLGIIIENQFQGLKFLQEIPGCIDLSRIVGRDRRAAEPLAQNLVAKSKSVWVERSRENLALRLKRLVDQDIYNQLHNIPS